MNFLIFVYTVFLFVILTPAILLRLPSNGNKFTVAFVHGIVFTIIFHFTHKIVWQLGQGREGFKMDSSSNTIREGIKDNSSNKINGMSY